MGMTPGGTPPDPFPGRVTARRDDRAGCGGGLDRTVEFVAPRRGDRPTRLRRALRTVASFGVTLLLAVTGVSAASAASAPSTPAARAAFVKAVHADDPAEASISDAELVVLGATVCDELAKGESVSAVAKNASGGAKGQQIPQQFVSVLLVESANHLCPKEVASVKKWAGSSAPTTTAINASLRSVMPPEATACSPVPPSGNPPGMVGLIDAVYCNLPKLGADSHLYAYLFDTAADYQASGTALFKYEMFDPTPNQGCPTTTSSQMGGQTWGNKTFPLRNGQDVQCLTVAPGNAGAGVPNTIPDYIWTVPTRHVILEALGDPGSTMQHLNAWWSADADT